MRELMFRSTRFQGWLPDETVYLILYDFRGAQRRDVNHRYVDPDQNKLRKQFFKKLGKYCPNAASRRKTDSDIAVLALEEAEVIYNMVIQHEGTAYLFESRLVQHHTPHISEDLTRS